MLLKYSFGMDEAYVRIFDAVGKVLDEGYRTADIMSKGKQQVGTAEIGDLITACL